MNSNINVMSLQNQIAENVRQLLRLPNGSHIEVNFRANTESPEQGGSISIDFSVPSPGNRVTGAPVVVLRGNQSDDDVILVLGALRDAYEKTKRPFIAISWFRDKYLPALGVDFSIYDWEAVINKLIARGDVVIEKVPHHKDPTRSITTIRTTDMPPAQDWKIRD